MRSVRFHDDPARAENGKGGPDGSPAGGRLNLLLSYAGWQAESWADLLPVLLEPMGVHAMRASDGRHAAEVLRSSPIHIAVVDLDLPLDPADPESIQSGGGFRLLELLSRQSSRPPAVVVRRSRTHRDDTREINRALQAGAFAVVERPQATRDLEVMLDVLRRCLARHYQGRWPGSSPPA